MPLVAALGPDCAHAPLEDGIPCDDGDPCTARDLCQAGECSGLEPTDCDDENPCTVDLCSPFGGCAHALSHGSCDDADPCTRDEQCVAGECRGGAAPPEVCNGADDDCDEIVDEDCACARAETLLSGSVPLLSEGGDAAQAVETLPRSWSLAARALAPGVWMSAASDGLLPATGAHRFSLPFGLPVSAREVEATLSVSADERVSVHLDNVPVALLSGDPSIPATLPLEALSAGRHTLDFEVSPTRLDAARGRGGLLFELTVLWLEAPGPEGCEADSSKP